MIYVDDGEGKGGNGKTRAAGEDSWTQVDKIWAIKHFTYVCYIALIQSIIYVHCTLSKTYDPLELFCSFGNEISENIYLT